MAAGWISKVIRAALYARDNNTCCYCGKVCKIGGSGSDYATLDHIVSQESLFKAAKSYAEFILARKDVRNLVVACMGCNSSKQETDLYVWCIKTGKDYYGIIAEIARRVNTPIVKKGQGK